MNLNERQVAILQEILRGVVVNISSIAKIYQKTRKTIYDDIDIINMWLKRNHLGNITKNQFGNYVVENSPPNIESFVQLEKEKIQSYSVSERRAYILFKIVSTPQINIDEIAGSLKVSKTSINTDINELKHLLLLQNINLSYYKGRYVLNGDEYNVRATLINIISPFAHKFLNEKSIATINIALINYDIYKLCVFMQQQRVEQGFHINYSIACKDGLYIADYLNITQNYYDNTLEQEYSALLLKGFSHRSTATHKNKLCELIIEQLILSFSTILSYVYDKNISQILYNHFESAIYRLSLGIVLSNPTLEDIINDYQQAYALAKLSISQFIKNEDFAKQESSYLAVLLISHSLTWGAKKDINTILKIVKTYVSEKNYNLIISQINAIYKQGDIMLSDILTENTIQIQESCENWENAVQIVAQPLLRDGYIEDGYVRATIANIKKNGAYVVLREGFALPHAQAGSFVNKIGMSLLILQEPVSFSNDAENMVYVIIMLAAIDAESHINALADMVNIISDDDTFNRLKACRAIADVLNIINKE
ncbi:MAG: PTS sugar transporter subunit IIA [Alphaproteobacteria bacterium]|jgi:mannitol/fructose-specific phosphotransferase system IIA component (Ntr-type)|nr:PTS sugar transporter subunit IIA [Alphaproteobacteria bacterium]